MKILHYFLGFPPYRTGGLTKYAYDLAKSQVADGHEVLALWPGAIRSYLADPKIKERSSVEGIRSLEIINPLPVPLDEGISEFDAFTKSCNLDIYKSFLAKLHPDIIHIHTLMGMHREFIQSANTLKIKTVMTSHDYFGLCPKVTLYRYGVCCDDDKSCRNCIQCNITALSLKKIKILQSPLYRWLKNNCFVKIIRKQHRKQFFGEVKLPDMPEVDVEKIAEKYRELRAYYKEIYESIDYIHFNSTLTETIYNRYMTPKMSKVVSITHSNVEDNRDNGHIDSDVLRIYCLAPAKPFKGWNVLKAACDRLKECEQLRFELHMYGPVSNPCDYMVVHKDGYKYFELPEMMRKADVVVAPSICYETFGFTVIEALSFGVPVIVSNHMGARDIVGDDGIVVTAGSVDELEKALKSIREYKVHNKMKIWNDFMNEIYDIYGE